MSFDPIALAGEVPDELTFDRAVLHHLDRSVGFDAAFCAIKGASATTINIDQERLDDAIAQGRYDEEIAPLKAAALAKAGVTVDTQVLGERQTRGLRYYRDFAAPVAARHSLLAFLRVRGTPIGALMLGRCGSTFSEEQVSLVEALLPRLAVARASFRPLSPTRPMAAPPTTSLGRLVRWTRGDRVRERVGDRAPEIIVRDRAGYREMVAYDERGELVWSRAALDEPARSGWFYNDLFHLAAVRAPNRRRFLFIGCGGGVSIRQFARVYPGATLEVVECDERVVALATRWFGLADVPNLSFTIADGATFLQHATRDSWDVIVVDAYGGTEIPAAFAGRRFFADVRRTLLPGGGLAFNVIGALGGHGDLQRIERAARDERLDVRLVPVLDRDEAYSPMAVRNVVLIARRS